MSGVLPYGWTQQRSRTTGRVYYFNTCSGDGVWTLVDVLKAYEAQLLDSGSAMYVLSGWLPL